MHDSPPRPIALIGLMGAGKSSVAVRVGERLGVAVADLDQLLVASTGISVTELFANEGEPAFREREALALAQALDDGAGVIACGGGVVTWAPSRALLRERCRVVWLEVSPTEAARRLAHESASRPLVAGQPLTERLATLARERHDAYAAAAHLRVATDGRSLDHVADAVRDALAVEP